MQEPAVFVRSVFDLKDLPTEGLPEIALIGRSNVGKSSLINALAGKKGLAKTSSTPGKTQCLNIYRFSDKYNIVDTPGYGYAKRSKSDREKWHKLMDTYIGEREVLRLVGIVIDARHPGLENDNDAGHWLAAMQKPSFVILTKSDKVSQRDVSQHEKYIKTEFSGILDVFSVSNPEGKGLGRLRAFLHASLRV
jgi:GTP-binding protein